jgi:hypothetical protein
MSSTIANCAGSFIAGSAQRGLPLAGNLGYPLATMSAPALDLSQPAGPPVESAREIRDEVERHVRELIDETRSFIVDLAERRERASRGARLLFVLLFT